ncbi:MAG TPA: PAS domain S-box protein [Bryobacteraceae bacterium]|nr:PAS domain S-box protein [Bryobacteraceae bacterium]
MGLSHKSSAAGYVWAATGIAIALGIRLLLDPVLGNRIPYATFYLAVTWAAVYAGLGPGMLAYVLSGLAALYFIVPPRHSFVPAGSDNQLGFALYVVVAGLLVCLSELQRRATFRAMAAAGLAEERRSALEREFVLRAKAEASERQQKELLRVTLSSIGDGVIATDPDARITFINPVAEALTGCTAADAIGQAIDDIFRIHSADSGATVECPVTRAIREGRIVGLANHTVLIAKDGRSMPIDDSGAPIIDSEGHVLGAVLVFRDVTDTKRWEADLLNRERMIDLAHDAIIVADAERRVISWNGGASEMYGWTEAEARGRMIHEVLKTREADSIPEIDRVLRDKGRWDGELVHTCRNGKTVISECRQVALRDEQGAITGIFEINRDITARKQAEEQLRRTAAAAAAGQRTLQALMEYIPEGIVIAEGPEARIVTVSRYAGLMSGRLASELLDTTAKQHAEVWNIYHPDGQTPAHPEELPLARAVVSGEITTDEEWVLKRADGTAVPVHCVAAPIRDGDGQITGGLLSWRDVSQWKALEEKLRQTAKLESLGVLAGGIAHDFNNLLTGVLGNASLLEDMLPQQTPEWKCAVQVSIAAQRAAKLTQQMLAYSGKGRFVIERIDISSFILETAALMQASIPKHVELRLQLADELPLIEADASQLQQVIMNLLINGAEAIGPEGGRLTVITRTETIDEASIKTLTFQSDVTPGTYVEIEVRDSGCGMDENTLARVFDPFFTTKFTGRGLGLAAVQGIVRGHKGAIKVYSAPGVGTTFRVLLPACERASAGIPEQCAANLQPVRGTGTVLLIDDEEVVRVTTKTALENLGYQVLLASDGREGIQLFRTARGLVSLVILDMTMPGISGEETMRQLREIKSGIPIMLSSGFSEAEARNRFGNMELAGFLQKPYSLGTLAEKVKTVARG